jgi:hypothetical protein
LKKEERIMREISAAAIEKIIMWLLSDDTGVSSKALCACYLDIPPAGKFGNHPRDPDDFGRCKRFLETLAPEDKKKAPQKAAGMSLEWEALVEEWGALEKMYNEGGGGMYQQMRKIIGGAK